MMTADDVLDRAEHIVDVYFDVLDSWVKMNQSWAKMALRAPLTSPVREVVNALGSFGLGQGNGLIDYSRNGERTGDREMSGRR